MSTIKALLDGFGTLTIDPSPRLIAYRKQMAERDRKQREAWAKMLSRESRPESTHTG